MSQADQDIAVEASLKTTGLGSAAVVDDGVVPTIDLRQDEAIVAQQLWEAATQVGFFTIIGHGIDASVVDQAFAASADFFAQPVQVKQTQSPGDMKNNAGFEYFSQVRPSTGVQDQKESLQITARQGVMDGRWPSLEFRSKAEALLTAAHALAGRILTLLEPQAVPHNAPGTLAQSHTLWADDGQCTLRFLHYPAMEDANATAQLLQQGHWRAGPHTDWDNVTLLFQRPGESGLECCANPRTGNVSEMYWTKVDPVEGGIAVNIGDVSVQASKQARAPLSKICFVCIFVRGGSVSTFSLVLSFLPFRCAVEDASPLVGWKAILELAPRTSSGRCLQTTIFHCIFCAIR